MRKETQNFINNIVQTHSVEGFNLRAIETQDGDLIIFKKPEENNPHIVLVTPTKKINVNVANVIFYHADLMKDFK